MPPKIPRWRGWQYGNLRIVHKIAVSAGLASIAAVPKHKPAHPVPAARWYLICGGSTCAPVGVSSPVFGASCFSSSAMRNSIWRSFSRVRSALPAERQFLAGDQVQLAEAGLQHRAHVFSMSLGRALRQHFVYLVADVVKIFCRIMVFSNAYGVQVGPAGLQFKKSAVCRRGVRRWCNIFWCTSMTNGFCA